MTNEEFYALKAGDVVLVELEVLEAAEEPGDFVKVGINGGNDGSLFVEPEEILEVVAKAEASEEPLEVGDKVTHPGFEAHGVLEILGLATMQDGVELAWLANAQGFPCGHAPTADLKRA